MADKEDLRTASFERMTCQRAGKHLTEDDAGNIVARRVVVWSRDSTGESDGGGATAECISRYLEGIGKSRNGSTLRTQRGIWVV